MLSKLACLTGVVSLRFRDDTSASACSVAAEVMPLFSLLVVSASDRTLRDNLMLPGKPRRENSLQRKNMRK